jgi:cytochrome c oxidase subunit 1
MGNFLVGGVTGVIVASPPLDFHLHDTQFVVAHFHYTIMGGSVFAVFAAIYFWFPKFTGVLLRESLGKLSFWLMMAGFNVTFWPLFVVGLRGMPRRVVDYDPTAGWTGPNLLATAGTLLLALGVITVIVNIAVSLRRKVVAGDDPWDANSLEWATSSPPPQHNFEHLPRIRSERPAHDLHHPLDLEERR